MSKTTTTDYLKHGEIDEQIRSKLQRKLQVTNSFILRLGLEKELEGHQGCVNCLEWNSEGRILASASDDFHVILWDPFKYQKIQAIQTGHHGNIFSVKFVPGSNDTTIVTGAGDFQVHTLDVVAKETTQMCTCAIGRVKRLATAPQLPHLFWSASEDGTVRQYDVRAPHSCAGDVTNILVYLRSHLGHFAEAKCLAINPMQPEILAVGANDPYVRVYDRRMIRLTKILNDTYHERNQLYGNSLSIKVEDNLPRECVQYFVAGHLPVYQKGVRKKLRSLAATYLTFGATGRDLLLNLGGEQIYLFDIKRNEKPKSFDLPKSVLSKESGSVSNGYSNGYHNRTNGYSSKEGKHGTQPLPDHVEALKLTANMLFEKEEYGPAIRLYNEAIQQLNNSPVLYGNRAAAYMKRDWDGDMYAALRDCHTTLSLDPNHAKAFFRLARCLNELHLPDKAILCLETFKRNFPNHANSHACQALEKDICMASVSSSEDTAGTDSDDLETATEGDMLNKLLGSITTQERYWQESSCDYDKRFYGHCNTTTDIKEANFFGSEGEYIVAGSDDGSIYIWDRNSTNNIRILKGDSSIVNCLQPHPTQCLLATSGIDPLVRLWSPQSEDLENHHVVKDRDLAALSNQRRMKADPLDVVLMNMGYHHLVMSEDSPDHSDSPPMNCQTS